MDPKKFFAEYARSTLDGDIRRIADFYAHEFVAASPNGSETIKNDYSFLDKIEQLVEKNRSSGMKGLDIVSVRYKEMEKDNVMVKVLWRATFVKEGKEIASEFEIGYLLDTSGDDPKIMVYYSKED